MTTWEDRMRPRLNKARKNVPLTTCDVMHAYAAQMRPDLLAKRFVEISEAGGIQ